MGDPSVGDVPGRTPGYNSARCCQDKDGLTLSVHLVSPPNMSAVQAKQISPLLAAYLRNLAANPLRTKSITNCMSYPTSISSHPRPN